LYKVRDVTPSSHVVSEAHRALELLEDYHEKLTKPQDKQLRLAIERVIRIFKSRLFQALLGECICCADQWAVYLCGNRLTRTTYLFQFREKLINDNILPT
jgi:hypothetical protein